MCHNRTFTPSPIEGLSDGAESVMAKEWIEEA
jgi:hypothetical protein